MGSTMHALTCARDALSVIVRASVELQRSSQDTIQHPESARLPLLLRRVACEPVTSLHAPSTSNQMTNDHARPIPKGNGHPRLQRCPPIMRLVRLGCLGYHHSECLEHVYSGLAIHSLMSRSPNPNCMRRAKTINSCLLLELYV